MSDFTGESDCIDRQWYCQKVYKVKREGGPLRQLLKIVSFFKVYL